MRKLFVALFVAVASFAPLTASAEIVDQIGTYTEVDFGGFSSDLSMFDNNLLDPFGQLGLAYDNFQFSSSGVITSMSWVGIYAGLVSDIGDPLTDPTTISPDFNITFYELTPSSYPTASFSSVALTNAQVTTTLLTDPGLKPYTYMYTANFAGPAITGGVEYWVSVSSIFDFDLNSWGLAFSNAGDNSSLVMFAPGNAVSVTSVSPYDYAISLTAIPEPGAGTLIAIAVGLLGFRRRRVS